MKEGDISTGTKVVAFIPSMKYEKVKVLGKKKRFILYLQFVAGNFEQSCSTV